MRTLTLTQRRSSLLASGMLLWMLQECFSRQLILLGKLTLINCYCHCDRYDISSAVSLTHPSFLMLLFQDKIVPLYETVNRI